MQFRSMRTEEQETAGASGPSPGKAVSSVGVVANMLQSSYASASIVKYTLTFKHCSVCAASTSTTTSVIIIISSSSSCSCTTTMSEKRATVAAVKFVYRHRCGYLWVEMQSCMKFCHGENFTKHFAENSNENYVTFSVYLVCGYVHAYLSVSFFVSVSVPVSS